MTTLPSFVELMATLGLEQQSARPEAQATTPSSSPSTSPRLSKAAPAKVRSNPALRDTRARPTRYSPYSPALVSTSNVRGIIGRSLHLDHKTWKSYGFADLRRRCCISKSWSFTIFTLCLLIHFFRTIRHHPDRGDRLPHPDTLPTAD